MAGAFHGPGEPECVINVGVSGPGVVRAALTKCPDGDLTDIADIIKKTAFKITRMGQLVGSEAVSYTHLDVYKRQQKKEMLFFTKGLLSCQSVCTLTGQKFPARGYRQPVWGTFHGRRSSEYSLDKRLLLCVPVSGWCGQGSFRRICRSRYNPSGEWTAAAEMCIRDRSSPPD